MGQVPTPIRSGVSLPSTCHGGTAVQASDAFIIINQTNNTGTLEICTGNNIWTPMVGMASPTNPGNYVIAYDVTSGATTPVVNQIGEICRAVTGSTSNDVVLYSDNACIVSHDRGATSAIVETVPTPTVLNNAGFVFKYSNHSTYTDTICSGVSGSNLANPTCTNPAWTINGNPTLIIIPGEYCIFTVNPNLSTSDWLADCNATMPSTVVQTNQNNQYSAGKKQIFVPSATVAGEAGQAVTANPLSPVQGDRWYRGDLLHYMWYDGTTAQTFASLNDIPGAIPIQYKTGSCQGGWGDGLNIIPAGTYSQTFCYNDSNTTRTITQISCYFDAGTLGTSNTLDVHNNFGVELFSLIQMPLPCSLGNFAITVPLSFSLNSEGYLRFTYVTDGIGTTQMTYVVTYTE